MAQYNCTLMGCVSAQTATYPNLQTCQAACVGWGCPPQLTTNTNIIFAYDGSGSYANAESRLGMFKSATAWTETLATAGWVGTQDHVIMGYGLSYDDRWVNTSLGMIDLTASANFAEDWLFHGSIPYVLTNQLNGTRNIPTHVYRMLFSGSENEIPLNVQQQYFSNYTWRDTLDSNNPSINTGATYPSVPTLVVSFMHQSSAYNQSSPVFKQHYTLWSDVRASSPNPDYHKAFLFPVKNICQSALYWNSLQQTLTYGIQSILNGNQDDVGNGGSGTLDGTWITYTNGQTMPNGNVCTETYCTTAPFGPATQNPCVEGPWTPCVGPGALDGQLGTFCYWSTTDPFGAFSVFNSLAQWATSTANPFWVAGNPTWGGLEDKGWGINVSLLGTDSALLATALNNSVGTVATPATICISAETLWNSPTQIDYPFQTLQLCNNDCFPLLDPWWCPPTGGGCTQDPAGLFGWTTSIPAGPYLTNQDAYTACTAQCNTLTSYTCSNYGCIQDASGIFSDLASCTASCQSYSCTTSGCYGPFQGTGETGTYLAMSSCTATCYHYECVTDSYVASILPNIYDAGTSSTNGCIQTSGSVNTSISNQYSALTSCTASCVSWQCCEPLGISDNSIMYVYYDITSMNGTQTEAAIKGIIDWTENHLEFTGHVYHLLWWSERWLQYAAFPYTLEAFRFDDSTSSSEPDASGGINYDSGAKFGTATYGHISYWTGSNSPAYVLDTIYDGTFGFDFWTSVGQYNGNATHSIHDSFEPGYSTSLKISWTDAITKGYDTVQSATTADDVINVIFQDESYSHYHPSSLTSWGTQPKPDYQNDHVEYFDVYTAVTATTLGGGDGGTIRSFLYPTLGATTAGGGFALHSVAAIDSGDQVPPDGKWSATTYPLNNTFLPTPHTHAQCEFSLSLLTTSNPYWTSTVPTWGGLDQYGWFINFRFDTYTQQVFETDLTAFLSSTTISCDTICVSAHTNISGEYPYSSQTLCEGLVGLGECTGCTRFNCGDNGCYTAVTGQYECLSACTAACASYSCTTSGCIDHNPPTGTTFPYTSTDAVSYYSYYGTGGTYLSSTLCQTECMSWECGQNACYPVIGTGGSYSNQTLCEVDCSGYTCGPSGPGCVTYIGDGSLEINQTFSVELDCITSCTIWECTILLGCIEVSQSPTTQGDTFFDSQTGCTAACQSFNCDNTGCYSLSNLSGDYQDVTQPPSVSSAACTASCVSWNCFSAGCSSQAGTGGTYTTSGDCMTGNTTLGLDACQSWTCSTWSLGTTPVGCELYNRPDYGTGGTFTALTECNTGCTQWFCDIPGCEEEIGTGTTNSYTSETACYTTGFDPDTGTCTTWNCTDTGCVALSAMSGQYSTELACTAACQSWSCGTGTYSQWDGGESTTFSWSGGGCEIYNAPNYGTGGTFINEQQCTGDCRSWDCTTTGCIDVSLSAGTGATYLTSTSCDTHCESYSCFPSSCIGQLGSGGTWFNGVVADWGLTACTGVCLSYNCQDLGCLPAFVGSGGTWFSADTTVDPPTSLTVSALTSCTAACLSYVCYTAGCVTYNPPSYGTGGTWQDISGCTACTDEALLGQDCPCINWGCIENVISTTSKIYAYYDTSSMPFATVKEAIEGVEAWGASMQNYTGSIYHTLINDERWLNWANSVYTATLGAGMSSVLDNILAWPVLDWASGQSMTNVYDNCTVGQSIFAFPLITTMGLPPVAANSDDVIVITFIDESGVGAGIFGGHNPYNVYTSDDAGNSNASIPNFAGLTPQTNDQPSPSWKTDYTGFSATYLTVTAASGTLNCFIYPTESSQPQTPENQLFALNVVASIDEGNQTPGSQGENWTIGTAPRRAVSGGILGGTPGLCALADLTALEVSNPYISQGYGRLDLFGWDYNITFPPFTTNLFQTDLDAFLSTIASNTSVCTSAATSPTSIYPFPTQSACTADCYSWECTVAGCIQVGVTGGTPTYYPTEPECQLSCTSWSCLTSSPCTEVAGTGSTFLLSGDCVTACTSHNCEDITPYTLISAWPNADGCIEQIGSGGTYYEGTSFLSYSACTGDCRSWDCTMNCEGTGTTGCTEWSNTAATYTAETACTGSCIIQWYCTEEYIASNCDGQTIMGAPGGVINNGFQPESPAYISSGYGALGWFADNAQYDTWSTWAFSMSESMLNNYGYPSMVDFCEGPYLTPDFPLPPPATNQITGYLVTLESIKWYTASPTAGNPWGFPIDYYDWATMISDFATIGANVNMSMAANAVFSEIQTWAYQHNQTLYWEATFNPCVCYPVPCDVFCDDGTIVIPTNALGPYSTSGDAKSACCEEITWSCVTATTTDSCSGKTTVPGQYTSVSDAYDWITVNLPNTDLNTLKYESTTPAVTISGACQGPNGGALYETSPIAFSWLNAGTSYSPWNLFINQLQGAGIAGVLSGMSYTDVNQYVFAQTGESINLCSELCFCITKPCECIEIYDGTGGYLTHADCMTGNTGLSACCPTTGVTGTSWNCVSGVCWSPICTTKPYIGHFMDEYTVVDNFRQVNPTGTFGNKRFTDTYNINALGNQVMGAVYTWNDVWSSISACTNDNPGVVNWEYCYKESTFNWGVGITMYHPYQYIKSISHPAVTGGLEYTNWNAFYTAAAASFTLTTSLTSLQVCQSIDSQYWASNIFGCVVETNLCCNRADCYCYEVYDNTGDFGTEAPCLTACCPTYTGWTCCNPNMNWSVGDCTDAANPFFLPCSYVSQSSPILISHFLDNALNASLIDQYGNTGGQAECNLSESCEEAEYWSCITTNFNTCDPTGTSDGELTGFTPQIAINNVQYPFSSSTDQYYQFLPNLIGYLGAYGQIEEILTDYAYYDPLAPFSSTTFQLGSFNAFNLMVDPNHSTADLPLPYQLPAETCYGMNSTGGTGMPMFHIQSISNTYINSNTKYYSWNELVTAAQNDTTIYPGGFAVSNTNNINDLATLYPYQFSCDSMTIAQGLPMLPIVNVPGGQGDPHWSGCSWHVDMVPCLCDTTCCCESGFTSGFLTQIECEDPLTGCCPSLSSYSCTILGCVDPGNGSGAFTGLTALADCEDVCKEWECISSTTITDTCGSKTIIPAGGALLPDITEYSPNYSPFVRGAFDALAWFADAANSLQGGTFSNYKWDCGTGCGWSTSDCAAPYGAWKHLIEIHIAETANPTVFTMGPYTTWVDLINDLNSTLGNHFSLTMLYNDVAQLLDLGIPGATPWNLEIMPVLGGCMCSPGPCDCVLRMGTGHTGYYHYLNYNQCQQDCCTAMTIDECSILITGNDEGVLYYDFAANTTTKLFDEPTYDKIDIAARQDKLWIYRTSSNTGNMIREYDCLWAPFQKIHNRDIVLPIGGRGLTATENANELLIANDKVYKLDISGPSAVQSLQFPLPSGLTCTGDILYDATNGNMIITYGTGATQYVGAFTSTGVKLQESHINSTTAGIGTNERIDSLFNSGTWSTGTYPYFQTPYNGPIYGITTERRVIELLTSPFQFAPLETQTLTLFNQITNNVNGATNILNVINGQLHDCVDININPTDVYWCDGLLGCLPYPPNVTPPNSTGPHIDLPTCEDYCNFVCGDCVGSCECTLITTPISSWCSPTHNMADCIIQNQNNTNIFNGGDGCCDCFGCPSVTFDYYDNVSNIWTQQTVNTNMSTWGNFASSWSSGILYSVGDVVMFGDPAGNTCCYTLVYPHYNNIQTPYDAWVEYTTNVANGIPTWPGANNGMSWIACDPDCPIEVTWSCNTGTTVATTNDTCGPAADTGMQGLSFTPQIQYIAGGGFTLWHTQFQDLKWDCGSMQVNLPAHPCPAPMAHWAKILGCRITHIGNAAPTPAQGALQTTWADFVDLINSLFGGVPYNFPYSNNWQDIEAVLVNHVGIECIWEYCECNPSLPSPITDSCVNKIDVTNSLHAFVGSNITNWVQRLNYWTTLGNPQQPTIADPNSGDIVGNYKYEYFQPYAVVNPCYGPLTGLYMYDTNFHRTSCRTRHAVQSAAVSHGSWDNYGQFVDWWNNAGMATSPFNLSYNDNWSTNSTKIHDWCLTGPDPDTGQAGGYGAGMQECSCIYPPTPSYEPCGCDPIYGPGGYPTSAACEDVCCTGVTSWSCDTGYTEYWSSTTTTGCINRINSIPVLLTNNANYGPGSFLEYISTAGNGLQYTDFSTMKYVLNMGAGASTTNYCYDIDEIMVPNGQYYWRFFSHIVWTNILSSSITTNWADFITALQTAGYPTVTLGMTASQVSQHMNTQYGVAQNWMSYVSACDCHVKPCECVEITGSTGYPTSASCESVCCPGDDNYKCTIVGCLPDANGPFTSLVSCSAVCQSWECVDQPCIGSCTNGGINTPRTELPIFGIPSDIIPYLANINTSPVQSPLLPPIGPNMQAVDISYYKFDCISCGGSASICDAPHGKWWAPSGLHIENVPTQPYYHYSGPHFTWEDLIDGANAQGFNALTYNSSYTDVVTLLEGGLRRIVIKGLPCYGQGLGCDCELIDGTGATGTWDITDYTDCYDACCSGETYDCIYQGGCVLNPNGTGQYPSLTACTGDCREWECVAGVQSSDDCAMNTFLNIDWLSLPYYGGSMNMTMARYFADPINGLQHNDVNNYKFTNQVAPTAYGLTPSQFHCEVGAQPWTSPTTTQPPYGVYSPSMPVGGVFGTGTGLLVAGNPTTFGSTPSFPNATSTHTWPGPNAASGGGCFFDTWADLITGCNMIGLNHYTTNNPLTLNDTFDDVDTSIVTHFRLLTNTGITLPGDRCLCSGTACSCTEWQGTGYTNFHTSESDCIAAATATPCCIPPTNLWYCEPGHAHAGTGTQDCVCVQGPGGTYASLDACKQDTHNCCDPHYYDCHNPGTPSAGCVGLILGSIGPYQTAAACDAGCPKSGYNCEWVLDDSPVPTTSGSYQCVGCYGTACQYTYVTSAGAPYFGDALAQCQSNCPGNNCWKCCMDHWGWITQLSPSLPPHQCKCPMNTVEVLCDGTGPCPHPVSCVAGYSYNWSLCRCVCEPDMSCALGYHWDYDVCTCVPNIVGPANFVGPQGEVLESISEFTQKTVRSLINEFVETVELLQYYRDHNYDGDICGQCTDGTQGTCFVNGCLYLTDTENVGWKSLLVDGTEAYLPTPNPLLPTTGTTGYTACADIVYDSSCPNNTSPSNTQQTDGCSTINGQTPTPSMAGDYIIRTGPQGGPTIYRIIAVGAQNTTIPGHAYHSSSCFTTGTTTGGTGYSCIDDRNNPPAYTKCLEYGTTAYVAYFGTAAPQYATLSDCFASGCDNSPTPPNYNGYSCIDDPNSPPAYTKCIQYGSTAYVTYFGTAAPQYASLTACYNAGCDNSPIATATTGTSYYMCAPQTNSLVGENQEACISVQGTGGLGTFISLNDCLNSGCAGWFTCDPTLVPEVNGVSTTTNCIYPVPMCCESYINSSIIPLTVAACKTNCTNMNETWFPLYNVTGINTYYESPLAYLTRELLPYVNNNTCLVSLTPETFTSKGYTMKTIYDINY